MTSTVIPDVLPLPADLPALRQPARLLVLGDLDELSYGLAEGLAGRRAPDVHVWAVLEQVMSTASRLGSRRCPVRWAASSATARYHLDVMTRSANNVWSIRRGLNGAGYALLEELEYIEAATISASRDKNVEPPADLIILIALGPIYAPAVRRLRLLGVPTWVLQPGRFIAAELYKAATAVTPLAVPMAA
jgi:hypothetical protein